jgi:uncharacterized membrane protein
LLAQCPGGTRAVEAIDRPALPALGFVVCEFPVDFARDRPMPCKSMLFPLLAVFAVACGQSASKDCPADNQDQCVDTTLSYDNGIGDLLTQRCSPCHAAGGVEMTRLLTDYGHVSGERTSIATQLVTCSMPPAGNVQLTIDERNQILDWLTCGAPK